MNEAKCCCLESYAPLLDPINLLAIIRVSFDAFPVPVEGFVREDIQAAPEAVEFGAVAVGQTVTEVIVLRSVANKDFNVEKVEISGSGARVEPAKQRASAPGRAFRVSQAIARVGPQSGTLTFTVRYTTNEVLRVVVPVSYHGIETTAR